MKIKFKLIKDANTAYGWQEIILLSLSETEATCLCMGDDGEYTLLQNEIGEFFCETTMNYRIVSFEKIEWDQGY